MVESSARLAKGCHAAQLHREDLFDHRGEIERGEIGGEIAVHRDQDLERDEVLAQPPGDSAQIKQCGGRRARMIPQRRRRGEVECAHRFLRKL